MGPMKIGVFAVLFSALHAPASGQATSGDVAPSAAPTHPREVAFVDEAERGWVYRKFPSGVRLYTYDRDLPGQSVCNATCVGPWPPVYAPAGAQPVGEWTIVQREDGTRQWALNGKPVYVRFHDTPDIATGDGIDGVWHIVSHMRPAGERTAETAAQAAPLP